MHLTKQTVEMFIVLLWYKILRSSIQSKMQKNALSACFLSFILQLRKQNIDGKTLNGSSDISIKCFSSLLWAKEKNYAASTLYQSFLVLMQLLNRKFKIFWIPEKWSILVYRLVNMWFKEYAQKKQTFDILYFLV